MTDQVDTADAVLILRPQSAAGEDAVLKRHLIDDPSIAEVLGVSFSQPPSVWYDAWLDVLGTAPTAAAVITTPDLADDDIGDRDLTVETIATPSNLTGIGVKSTPYLNGWSNAVVVVDSLTTLLQYADPQTVYRFLHVLTTRLHTTGAHGQFYLDPTPHDEQTVELLKTLFETVIEYDERDGGWRARVRE